VDAWNGADAGNRFLAALAAYDGVVVVGADMMDGLLLADVNTQNATLCDSLERRRRRPTIILGSASNEHPSSYARVPWIARLEPVCR